MNSDVKNSRSPTQYDNLCNEMEAIYRTARKRKKIGFNLLEELAQIITLPSPSDEIDSDTFLFNKAFNPYINNPVYPAQHSINVAILSIAIAKELRYDEERIQTLRLAALLHDIGTTQIPEEILKKPGQLLPEEFAFIIKSPDYAQFLFESVPETKQPPWPEVKKIIAQVKEREDGSGYPQGLSGKDIGEPAKIVGLIEIFETLTSGRDDRNPLLPYQAVAKICQMKGKFPVRLVKTLLKITTYYPVGTVVMLSTGEYGIVKKTTANVYRPIIEILLDHHGEKPSKEKIQNLKENNLVSIERVIIDPELIKSILNKNSGKK